MTHRKTIFSKLTAAFHKRRRQCVSMPVLLIMTLVLSLGLTNIAKAETLTNTATATYTVNGENLERSASKTITKDSVVTTPDEITLQKQANKTEATYGDLIRYTIIVSNPNSNKLENITVQDILPTGLIYKAGSAALNNNPLNASQLVVSGNTLSFKLGSLAAQNSARLTYQVAVGDNSSVGPAINQAFVTSESANSTIKQAQVNINDALLAPLQLEKRVNKNSAKIGDAIRYTLSINNPNRVAIAALRVRDDMPAGLEYIAGSAKLNNNDTVNVDRSSGLVFKLGAIPAHAQWTLTYDAQIKSGVQSSTLLNQARIITNQPAANSSTAKAVVELISDNIVISKTVDKQQVNISDELEYQVTIRNPAQHDLDNLAIDDVMPAGFIYINDSARLDGQPIVANRVQATGRSLHIKLGQLARGKSLKVTYRVTVSEQAASGEAINQVQASSDFALSDLATASVQVRTPSTINFLRIDDEGAPQIIPPTSFNDNQNGGRHWQEITSISLPDGSLVNLPTPQPLVEAQQYSSNDPVVIQVRDLDQNIDPNTRETIIVTITVPGTNDKEVLLLTETSPDSGVFRGVILTGSEAAQLQNGVLSLKPGVKITVSYHDQYDRSDTSATAALVIPETRLALDKTADKYEASVGELVRYTLAFDNTANVSLPGIVIEDRLPPGFRYVAGSAALNGVTLPDRPGDNEAVVIKQGRLLTFKLQDMPRGAHWTLEYVAKISAGVQTGKAINQAQIVSGRIKSNLARATVIIKDELMRTRNILTGRVFIGCPSTKTKQSKTPDRKVLENARIYMETGRSVLSDKEGFWHMEGVEPGAHVLQLDVDSLPTGYKPSLCNENTRFAGDAQSRFVDLAPGTLWQVDFYVKKDPSATQSTEQGDKKQSKVINPLKRFGGDYLKTANADFEILWPPNNHVPDVASTKIIVKSPAKHKVELFLNGKKVNPLNYDGSDSNKARTVTIRRWLGVDIDIKRRDNTLLAILKDKSGKEIARKTHNIHFSGEAASAEYLPEQSSLIADGKTTPVIALRIYDQDGYPMRANTHGYFTLENSDYQVKTLAQNKDKLNLNESLAGSYKYLIGHDGVALIELNPTTRSGEVRLHLQFNKNRTQTLPGGVRNNQNRLEQGADKIISVWLKPHLRKWIMVGIAEGTLGYSTLSGHMQTLKELDKDERFYKRGRLAFFARGRIKGKYLLTLAYDTHKKKGQVGSQLDGNIDPDAWYTIYADNSTTQYDAPSSRKLYVKIEKDNFYALFGDFNTGLSVTELAKYERVLNGVKTEYQDKRYSVNAFISETANKHQHQEIPGDGTSGLYYLKRGIIANSETIKIETRDRFHSDRIIESRTLSRFQDYDIDYQAGTLFFKFPITARDRDFNPIIIVADYDLEDDALDNDNNQAITAGGRVAARSKNRKLEVGLSALNEGRNKGRDDRMIAADATYHITPDTKLHAEIAQSKTQQSHFKSRSAYIIELEKQISKMEARLYHKKRQQDFGIASQSSEDGTTKSGAEVRYRLNEKTSVDAEVSQQKNLSNNNERQLAQLNINHRYKQFDLNAGLRHSKEKLEDQTISGNSALVGGKYTSKSGKITLRGAIEKNIDSNSGSEINPDRAVVGTDVKLKHGFSVFAEHETTDNGVETTHNNRVGVTKPLWEGATGKTTYTQEKTAQGQREYATLGLSQKIKLTDKINADFSIDQAKTIRSNLIDKRFNQNEPAIQGAQDIGTQTDDYTAFSVGLGSNQEDWSWTTRFELRNGKVNDKINFRAGLIRHLADGKNLSAKLSVYRSENELDEFENHTRLSLGSAWHPKNRNFVFINRLDLVDENDSLSANSDSNAYPGNNASGLESHTQKIIHNMHYNHKINDKTQISLHHGIKHVSENNKGVKSNSTVDTATVEMRRDINKKWDIGIQGGYLHDWSENTVDYLAGVSLGVTPMENAWLGLGYNIEGFDDKDFDKNNYKRQGPYVNFRYKFNQDSFDGDLPVRRGINKKHDKIELVSKSTRIDSASFAEKSKKEETE